MTSPSSKPRPTIYDVAREAGVSKSLVSLVLNDSPLVAEAKREAVRDAIRKLGYRRSQAASSLASNRTRTIGLVIDDFRNPWFVELLSGLRTTMGPHGFHVAVREHFTLGGTTMNAIDGFRDTQVDALVVAAEPGRDFEDLGIPTVLEGTRCNTIEGADLIGSDQAQGVNLLMEHLRSLGHERIGHVTGAGGSAGIRRRAYSDFMESAGLEPLVNGFANPTNEEGGYLGTVELLREHPGLTAVFTANDTMALGARAALRETGYEVPGDVSLIGFDNSQLARSRFLDLTTVDNHAFDVGVACAEALLRRIADPGTSPGRITIPTGLVIRTSSAAPRTRRAGEPNRGRTGPWSNDRRGSRDRNGDRGCS